MSSFRFTIGIAILALAFLGSRAQGADSIFREGWSFSASDLEWADPRRREEFRAKGQLAEVVGWAEYRFHIPKNGWFELWEFDNPPAEPRDVFLDNRLIFPLATSTDEDIDTAKTIKGWFKEANLWLTAGEHTIRFRRLGQPGSLPSKWELRPSGGRPAASLVGSPQGSNVVRAGSKGKVKVLAGACGTTLQFDFVFRNQETGQMLPAGSLSVPAGVAPALFELPVTFPSQGVYTLLAKHGENVLRPADLKAGQYIVVDAKAPPPAVELKTTPVIDIDCVAQTIGGQPAKKGETYFEKDCKTRIVEAPFGKYRETEPEDVASYPLFDGFAYRFDLPNAANIYRLRVEYPDDDRRSVGFWIRDGQLPEKKDRATSPPGMIATGGVETGDHYRCSRTMVAHEAFFYPLAAKGLTVAVVNLHRGSKAAAARIRIDRLTSELPAAPGGRPGGPADGRAFAFHFPAPNQWLRAFGARGDSPDQHLLALELWARWNRYFGATAMIPTLQAQQQTSYPSKLLEGYANDRLDLARLGALVAEKYGQQFVPEVHFSGQPWFEKRVLGIWTEETAGNPRAKIPAKRELAFRDLMLKDCLLCDRDGHEAFGQRPFALNPLHPKSQEISLAVVGELADRLADCPSFTGVSCRLPLRGHNFPWLALPDQNWGYDDWTIAEFEKDANVQTPGRTGDSKRFRERYDFLLGEGRAKWTEWRCKRLFQFHCRLRDRIRQANPNAQLFIACAGVVERDMPGTTMFSRLREMGVDCELYAKEPGIVVSPCAIYGRRNSTPVGDAEKLDPLFDPVVRTLPRQAGGGFTFQADAFPGGVDWTKFGGPPGETGADACQPAGIHEREMFALALADGDARWLRNSGAGWIFGTPATLQPWLREYRLIPILPFSPAGQAVDPVAIWHTSPPKDPEKPTETFFYAVNRLPYPVTVELAIEQANRVFTVADNRPAALSAEGKLAFSLDPYMVRVFRAEGVNTAIGECQTKFQTDPKAQIETAISFSGHLRNHVAAGRLAPEFSDGEAKDAVGLLHRAIDAFAEGRWHEARVTLERPALVRLYESVAQFPPGLYDRQVPRGFPRPAANAPKLVAEGESSILGDLRGRLPRVNDLFYDAQGILWAASDDRVMTFDVQGKYRREHRLAVTGNRIRFDALRVLAEGQIAVMANASTLRLFEPAHDRRLLDDQEVAFPMPGDRCRLVATDQRGSLFVACGDALASGIWKYRADGTPSRQFGENQKTHRFADTCMGMVQDAKGLFYLSHSGGIRVLRADGSLVAENSTGKIALAGPLSVTADGSLVTALVDRGASLAVWRNGGEGKFNLVWQKPLPTAASAIAFAPDDQLTVGFAQPTDQAAARDFRIGPNGLTAGNPRVGSLVGRESSHLGNFAQLKAKGDRIYFLANNRLMRLTPGTPDKIDEAYNPGPLRAPIDSFAMAPNGDLYLASNAGLLGNTRGVNLYMARKLARGWEKPAMLNRGKPLVDNPAFYPTDMECDAKGRLLLRYAEPRSRNTQALTICRINATGAAETIATVGHAGGGFGAHGLHIAATGNIFIAGGNCRNLTCVAPDGQQLWQREARKDQAPDSLPLRRPLGVTTDRRGRVWMTDAAAHRIHCFAPDGSYLAGYGHFGTIDDREPTALCEPIGIAAVRDAAGKEWLYVADVENQRITKFQIE